MNEEKAASADRMAEAIQAEAEWAADKKGALLNGWYLVAEWVTPDGNMWLSRCSAKDSTCWARIGMLEFARDWEREDSLADDE